MLSPEGRHPALRDGRVQFARPPHTNGENPRIPELLSSSPGRKFTGQSNPLDLPGSLINIWIEFGIHRWDFHHKKGMNDDG